MLNKNSTDARRSFYKKHEEPYLYAYVAELERRLLFEKPVDESLMLHAIFESVLKGFFDLKGAGRTSDDVAVFLRNTIKKFIDADIKSIFVGQEDISEEAIKKRIEEKLKEKGITIPAPPQEPPAAK